jgi:hypothetical protein
MRILALVASIVLLVVLASYMWLRAATERSWTAMEKRVGELIEISRSASSARPVLRGSAQPGNSWEYYEPALAGFRRAFDSTPGLSTLLSDCLFGTSRGPTTVQNLAKMAAVLETLQPDFDRVVRGSSCAEGQYPWPWERLTPDDWQSGSFTYQAQLFTNSGVLEARRRMEGRKPIEAMDLILAFMRFGRDLGDNGSLIQLCIGMSIIRTAGNELQAMVVERKFDREQLLTLERSLDILDRDFLRVGPAFRNEQISYGNLFLRGMSLKDKQFVDGPDPRTIQAGWRHGYSMRALQADAFLRLDDWCGWLSDIDALPFPEVLVIRDALVKERDCSLNQWAIALGQLIPNLRVTRVYQTGLRLLRAAILYRAQGEVPVLSDPFGTVLKSSLAGGTLRIWSVGRDGIDDGGKPATDDVLELDP